jgi:hypothetical protein
MKDKANSRQFMCVTIALSLGTLHLAGASYLPLTEGPQTNPDSDVTLTYVVCPFINKLTT